MVADGERCGQNQNGPVRFDRRIRQRFDTLHFGGLGLWLFRFDLSHCFQVCRIEQKRLVWPGARKLSDRHKLKLRLTLLRGNGPQQEPKQMRIRK